MYPVQLNAVYLAVGVVVGVLFIIATGLSFALCISVVVARRILDPKGLENVSFPMKLTRNVTHAS